MSLEKFIHQEFPIKCSGRNSEGKEILDQKVDVTLFVYQFEHIDACVGTNVRCPFINNVEGLCKVASINMPKAKNVRCPFVVRLPYTIDELMKKSKPSEG